MQKPLITVLLLIIGLSVATKIKSFIKNNAPEVVAPVEEIKETETVICTMDAMMCPDGTYVGRTGLKCEFVCLEIATTTEKVFKPNLSLNQVFELDSGVQFKVMAVTEDSRCPSDVTCIQAGRSKIFLSVGSTTAELEMGQSVKLEGFTVAFDDIQPYPISTHKILDDEYRLTLSIKPIQ